MDKKNYLIKVLTQLESIRSEATQLKKIVEKDYLDDFDIQSIINALNKAIINTKNKLLKDKFKNALLILKKIQKLEAESKKQDEKELKELEHMFEML